MKIGFSLLFFGNDLTQPLSKHKERESLESGICCIKSTEIIFQQEINEFFASFRKSQNSLEEHVLWYSFTCSFLFLLFFKVTFVYQCLLVYLTFFFPLQNLVKQLSCMRHQTCGAIAQLNLPVLMVHWSTWQLWPV